MSFFQNRLTITTTNTVLTQLLNKRLNFECNIYMKGLLYKGFISQFTFISSWGIVKPVWRILSTKIYCVESKFTST